MLLFSYTESSGEGLVIKNQLILGQYLMTVDAKGFSQALAQSSKAILEIKPCYFCFILRKEVFFFCAFSLLLCSPEV